MYKFSYETETINQLALQKKQMFKTIRIITKQRRIQQQLKKMKLSFQAIQYSIPKKQLVNTYTEIEKEFTETKREQVIQRIEATVILDTSVSKDQANTVRYVVNNMLRLTKNQR